MILAPDIIILCDILISSQATDSPLSERVAILMPSESAGPGLGPPSLAHLNPCLPTPAPGDGCWFWNQTATVSDRSSSFKTQHKGPPFFDPLELSWPSLLWATGSCSQRAAHQAQWTVFVFRSVSKVRPGYLQGHDHWRCSSQTPSHLISFNPNSQLQYDVKCDTTHLRGSRNTWGMSA